MIKRCLIILSLLIYTNSYATVPPKDDTICLAKNIYFEARGESRRGKRAVAQVTLNRVKHKSFKNSICEVVYRPYQFSWTLKSHKITNYEAWIDALAIASEAIETGTALKNFSALYFHARHIMPKWAMQKHKIETIGSHIFYV